MQLKYHPQIPPPAIFSSHPPGRNIIFAYLNMHLTSLSPSQNEKSLGLLHALHHIPHSQSGHCENDLVRQLCGCLFIMVKVCEITSVLYEMHV